MRGDDVSRMVVREAAAHLRPGGHGFVLVSWGVPPNAEWQAPLEGWVRDTGCDAWFLHQARGTPLGYAATWNEPLQHLEPGVYERALDEWVAYYRELGYASIGYGAVILRKRASKAHWMRADDIHEQREPASGAQIARLIAAEDYLATHDDAKLLGARLAVEPGHRLDQVLRVRDGAFAVEGATLRLEDGLRFQMDLDAYTAELVSRLDGRRTLAEAAAEVAHRFASDQIAASDLVAEAPVVARQLIRSGLVRLDGH